MAGLGFEAQHISPQLRVASLSVDESDEWIPTLLVPMHGSMGILEWRRKERESETEKIG
jgi:hypothetical protein